MPQRMCCHRGNLIANRHHCRHLQLSWNKHGAKAFVFVVLEVVASYEMRMRREQELLDASRISFNSNRLVKVMLPATALAMGQSMKGRKRDPKAVAATAAAHRGMKRSAETCERIRRALTGRIASEKERANHFRTHTAASRLKMSMSRKGKPLSAEHRMSLVGMWRRRTSEQRAVIADKIRISITRTLALKRATCQS